MSLKPIKLCTHAGGPNPWKVAIILEELGLPYETEFFDFSVLHTPEFEKPYSANGRVPVIVDPNASDFVLWESGAIVEYLVSKYDTSNKLCSAASSPEFYLEKQFLHFQMSGQGPYFGQAYWFTKLHAEKLPSAIERYQKEIARVVHVLDMSLQGKEYLVGGKVSYADLSFVPWFWIAEKIHPEWASVVAENKSFVGWLERLEARPAVKKMKEQRAEKMEG